jgi:taurine transport system substrate-binding protein
VRAFGSNSLDLGLLGSVPAAKSLSAPLDLPIEVVWVQDVIGAAESLVVRDEGVRTVGQLRGKRIGVPFGSTSQFSLVAALAQAGIAKDVAIVNLGPDAILGAWQGGQIDAAWIWQPTLAELEKTGHVVMTASDMASVGSPTLDLEAVRSEFARANPKTMRMWGIAQNWAATLLRDHRDEATPWIAGQLGIPVDQARVQLDGYRYLTAEEQAGPSWFGGGLANIVEKTALFLRSQGEIEAVRPHSTYIDATQASAVHAAVA